jgi:hypothetical protein
VNTASVNLRRLAGDVADIPRVGMIAAAKTAKKVVADEGARIAGSDGLKGKKKRGLKLRARDDIRNTATGATCRIQGSIPGWIWANTGTAPHAIRRRKKGPMRKMVVHHPGTPARHAWDRASNRVADVVPLIFVDELHKVITGG